MEDVEPPLALDTPILLVKPNVGLSTPSIFKALDLQGLSTQDPMVRPAQFTLETRSTFWVGSAVGRRASQIGECGCIVWAK